MPPKTLSFYSLAYTCVHLNGTHGIREPLSNHPSNSFLSIFPTIAVVDILTARGFHRPTLDCYSCSSSDKACFNTTSLVPIRCARVDESCVDITSFTMPEGEHLGWLNLGCTWTSMVLHSSPRKVWSSLSNSCIKWEGSSETGNFLSTKQEVARDIWRVVVHVFKLLCQPSTVPHCRPSSNQMLMHTTMNIFRRTIVGLQKLLKCSLKTETGVSPMWSSPTVLGGLQ